MYAMLNGIIGHIDETKLNSTSGDDFFCYKRRTHVIDTVHKSNFKGENTRFERMLMKLTRAYLMNESTKSSIPIASTSKVCSQTFICTCCSRDVGNDVNKQCTTQCCNWNICSLCVVYNNEVWAQQCIAELSEIKDAPCIFCCARIVRQISPTSCNDLTPIVDSVPLVEVNCDIGEHVMTIPFPNIVDETTMRVIRYITLITNIRDVITYLDDLLTYMSSTHVPLWWTDDDIVDHPLGRSTKYK